MADLPSSPESKEPDLIGQHIRQRLRELRAQRGWSLASLTQFSGVSRSMLSQIERGQANPTLGVADRIARAFGLTLAEFVQMPRASQGIEFIRSDDRASLYRNDEVCQIRTLSPLNLEKDVEFYHVCLHPGGALRSAAHYRGTREFLTLEKGKIRLESSDETKILDPGDSATYRADVPHALINLGRSDAVLFLVVIYRSS